MTPSSLPPAKLPPLPPMNLRDPYAIQLYKLLKRSRTALLWARAEHNASRIAKHEATFARLTRLLEARNLKMGVKTLPKSAPNP